MDKKIGPGRRNGTRDLEVTVADQRRHQIIESARACITEEGLDRLTLRKVAERARVSHATIAYYFHTRKELIDSALLETSEEFMAELRRRELFYGTQDLVQLVDTFLDPENLSSRFVVQMIDAGLHDANLLATHQEFIDYGRDRIEKSIRAGIETGDLRSDIDPKLAAALFHTVLIWWQSELTAETTTREKAIEVGRLVLRLLERHDDTSEPGDAAAGRSNGVRSRPTPASPIEAIKTSLLYDPRLSTHAAATLAETFEKLYELAAGLPDSKKGKA